MASYIVSLGDFLDLKKLKALLKTMKSVNYTKDLVVTLTDTDRILKMLEEYEERRIFRETSGYAKVENYVKDLARNQKFLKFLKKTRINFGIPERGFDYSATQKNKDKEPKKIQDGEGFTEYMNKFIGKHKVPGLKEFIVSYILFNDIKSASENLFKFENMFHWKFFQFDITQIPN